MNLFKSRVDAKRWGRGKDFGKKEGGKKGKSQRPHKKQGRVAWRVQKGKKSKKKVRIYPHGRQSKGGENLMIERG